MFPCTEAGKKSSCIFIHNLWTDNSLLFPCSEWLFLFPVITSFLELMIASLFFFCLILYIPMFNSSYTSNSLLVQFSTWSMDHIISRSLKSWIIWSHDYIYICASVFTRYFFYFLLIMFFTILNSYLESSKGFFIILFSMPYQPSLKLSIIKMTVFPNEDSFLFLLIMRVKSAHWKQNKTKQ